MSEKYEDGEFWLPAEFLDDNFFFKEKALLSSAHPGNPSSLLTGGDTTMESESEEEDYIAGLTRQMAHSFLGEEQKDSNKIMGTSPQSTLSDAGAWSASSRGSPNGPSQVSSPPSTPLDNNRDDAWELLYAAAGQVGRIKQNERGLLIPPPPKKPISNTKIPLASSTYRNCNPPFLTQQQLRVAQFQQLKRDQMIKQQLSSVWGGGENRAGRNINRSTNGSPFTWPQLQRRQQQGSGMRALFLNSSGTRRESAGTGVFLPRRAGVHNDTRKKPACSSVLLPAKVVHALNLNLEETEIYPRYPTYFSFDNHDFGGSHRDNLSVPRRPTPSFVSSHEVRLPQEWTY